MKIKRKSFDDFTISWFFHEPCLKNFIVIWQSHVVEKIQWKFPNDLQGSQNVVAQQSII
jgi:hypothetical protein